MIDEEGRRVFFKNFFLIKLRATLSELQPLLQPLTASATE